MIENLINKALNQLENSWFRQGYSLVPTKDLEALLGFAEAFATETLEYATEAESNDRAWAKSIQNICRSMRLEIGIVRDRA